MRMLKLLLALALFIFLIVMIADISSTEEEWLDCIADEECPFWESHVKVIRT